MALESIDEFTSRVDARSLSIPAKLPSVSEISGLRSEFQVKNDH